MQAAAHLRRCTAGLHRETEAFAFGREIMEKSLSPGQYRSLIDKNHYLHSRLEPLLSHSLATFSLSTFLPYLPERLPALRSDIALLGIHPTDFKVPDPVLEDRPQLLGALYVLLGSTLGSKVIYPALKTNPALEYLGNFHFFASGSRYPAQEWPSFCRQLDRSLTSEADLEQAGRGAQATFRFFHAVYAEPMEVRLNAADTGL